MVRRCSCRIDIVIELNEGDIRLLRRSFENELHPSHDRLWVLIDNRKLCNLHRIGSWLSNQSNIGNQGNVIATSERLLRRKFGSSRAIASSLLKHCRTTFQTKCYLRPQLMIQFRFCESTSVSSSDVTRADEDALIDRMMDSTVLQLIEKTCPQCPRFTVRLRTNVKHSNCVLQMA